MKTSINISTYISKQNTVNIIFLFKCLRLITTDPDAFLCKIILKTTIKRNFINKELVYIFIFFSGKTRETIPAVRPLGAKPLLDYMSLWVSFGLEAQPAIL